jgi:OOP family OmpA-OmpF porin
MSAIAFAFLALASSAALAENGTGFYLGGGAGYAGQRASCEGYNCDTSHANLKLLGGYQITPNIAVEGSYGSLGKITFRGSDLSIKTDGFTAAVLGMFPVSKEVDLFGKLGMYASKTRVNITIPRMIEAATYHSNGLLAGFGAQYKFTANLIGRVEYERLARAVRVADSRGDINLLTASVLYQF